MVTTEVRVTAEASVTSDDHLTPPTTPTPSIAPVLPCKPATHHGHHPWASPSVGHHHHPSDFDPDDFDLEFGHPTTHPTRSPSSSGSRSRTTKPIGGGATTTTITSTSSPQLTSYTTISSNYHPPSSASHRRKASKPTTATSPRSWLSGIRSGTRHFLTKLSNLDPVKLAYLRTSFVFAISILITWTPSSINRVYTLIHPTRFNFGLNMASAVVLPLQGVWNAVIYCATSWFVLADEVADLRGRVVGAVVGADRKRSGSAGVSVGFDRFDGRRRRGRGERGFELSPAPKVSTMRVVRGSF